MKRLPTIKRLLSAIFLLLLTNQVSVASDLIEPTRSLNRPPEKTGSLPVFSEPPGLDVTMDGTSIGKTAVVDLRVKPGKHIPWLQDVETEIAAEAGELLKLSRFKDAFIRVPVKEQEARVQQSITNDEASKINISAQFDAFIIADNFLFLAAHHRSPQTSQEH
jgi:hypothetical protein